MKTINRDKIQRMVGQGTGGGGGRGSVDLSGYATQAWVEQNYISKKFFSSLFKIYDGNAVDANEIVPNAEMPDTTTNVNIEAMFGFWTNQYLSALGKNSSGGGGGGGGSTYLNDLLDVTITNAQEGQILVYRDGDWINEDAPQSSGGTVTRVGLNVPTGLVVTGSPITTSGTFEVTLGAGYTIPTTSDVSKGVTAFGNFDADGNAKIALKLTTVNKKAWGKTYWTSGGVPTTISGDMIDVGDITMYNNKKIKIMDSNNAAKSCLTVDTSNNLVVGEQFDSTSGYNTCIRGNAVTIQTGAQADAVYINNNGLVEIVQSTQGIKIGNAYIVWDATNQALKVTAANDAAMDFYATGGVSALGYSS